MRFMAASIPARAKYLRAPWHEPVLAWRFTAADEAFQKHKSGANQPD
jgi:hypothetical protein